MVVAAQGSTFLEASTIERGIAEANPASGNEPVIPLPTTARGCENDAGEHQNSTQ